MVQIKRELSLDDNEPLTPSPPSPSDSPSSSNASPANTTEKHLSTTYGAKKAKIATPAKGPKASARVITPKTQNTTKEEPDLSSSSSSPVTASPNTTGTWTPQAREELIEHLLAVGIKGSNVVELAMKLGVSVIQVRNATQAGKKGNLRWKAVKSVRGDQQ